MVEKADSLSTQCEVINIKGLHARAAAQIVSLVAQFECELTISHKSKSASGASLIKLLTLDAPKGSIVTIEATGKQKKEAIKALSDLFAKGFDEI